MFIPWLMLLALIGCSYSGSLWLADASAQTEGWSQFRGSERNGSVHGLPQDRLRIDRVWEFPLPSDGVGGIAASSDIVVVSSRDFNDQSDVFYLINPDDGGLILQHQYRAAGKLDFGNSPRATPLIGPECVYVLGAFGHLSAIDPLEGNIRWTANLVEEHRGKLPIWGYCASPLLVDGKLIVQPGGIHASVIAFDSEKGTVLWRNSSAPMAAYASPCLKVWDGSSATKRKRMIVGCDQAGLVAWDTESGSELWRIRPHETGEFMVPSPLVLKDDIYWLGENNGLRRYRWSEDGSVPVQQAQNREVANDTHSPASLGQSIITINHDLVMLDGDNLREFDRIKHDSLDSYASVFTETNHAIVCCSDGSLLLIAKEGDRLRLIDQAQPHRNEARVLAHAAFHNGLLFMRKARSVVCYRLR